MDIFFSDPDDVPVPPDEVQIRYLEARPYPDGERVAVRFEVTPFQKRPNFELTIANSDGEDVAALSVVEAIENRMELTMHLRGARPADEFSVTLKVFYADMDEYEMGEQEIVKTDKPLAETVDASVEEQTTFRIPPEDN